MGYLKNIIKNALLPWVAYSVLSQVYFAHTLDQNFENAEKEEVIIWKAVGVSLLILVSYLLYIEAKQAKKARQATCFLYTTTSICSSISE